MQLHPTIKLLEHITAALLVKECRPIEPDFCGCLMVGRITTAHNSIQNTILTVCHANKWKHIPRIKLVELEPFSFSSTIYTTFFRECRPIEPDFCGRIMAGFILHHCLTQILDLTFSFLIQVSNLQIRQKSFLTEILFFFEPGDSRLICVPTA